MGGLTPLAMGMMPQGMGMTPPGMGMTPPGIGMGPGMTPASMVPGMNMGMAPGMGFGMSMMPGMSSMPGMNMGMNQAMGMGSGIGLMNFFGGGEDLMEDTRDQNSDDLGADEHLTSSKARLEKYLQKQWQLGKRKLQVQVDFGNVPLEWEYLNQYHGVRHPLAMTGFGPKYGLAGPPAPMFDYGFGPTAPIGGPGYGYGGPGYGPGYGPGAPLAPGYGPSQGSGQQQQHYPDQDQQTSPAPAQQSSQTQ